MSEKVVPGTDSLVGQHRVRILERRSGPFGFFRRYVVSAAWVHHLMLEDREVGQRLDTELEATFRRLEQADRAHTAVIEGLMRGGIFAARERIKEFR